MPLSFAEESILRLQAYELELAQEQQHETGVANNFAPDLIRIKSLQELKLYILAQAYSTESELSSTEDFEAKLVKETYKAVSERFARYWYPRHTIHTNPIIYVLNKLSQGRIKNEVFLPEELLEAHVIAGCGNVASLVIAILREFGIESTFVSFEGHDIVWAKTKNKDFMIDADLECLANATIEELSKNASTILRSQCPHLSKETYVYLVKAYGSEFKSFGFTAPPTSSPRQYMLQKAIRNIFWLPLGFAKSAARF